jgi:acetolactate synthase-1/2/3 large subunit
MHMTDELNTAAAYGLQAIFVVLNNGCMNIVRDGMERNGRPDPDAEYPPTDFAAVARAKGADGVRVTDERDLDAALQAAIVAKGPYVVDVIVTRDPAPIGERAKR